MSKLLDFNLAASTLETTECGYVSDGLVKNGNMSIYVRISLMVAGRYVRTIVLPAPINLKLNKCCLYL